MKSVTKNFKMIILSLIILTIGFLYKSYLDSSNDLSIINYYASIISFILLAIYISILTRANTNKDILKHTKIVNWSAIALITPAFIASSLIQLNTSFQILHSVIMIILFSLSWIIILIYIAKEAIKFNTSLTIKTYS